MTKCILPVRRAGYLVLATMLTMLLWGCTASRSAQDGGADALSVAQCYETCAVADLLHALASLNGDLSALSDSELSGIARRLQHEAGSPSTYMAQAMDELGQRGSYDQLRRCLVLEDGGSRLTYGCQYFALHSVVKYIPDKAEDAFTLFLRNPSTSRRPHDAYIALTLAASKGVRCDPALLEPLLAMGYDARSYRCDIWLEHLEYDGPGAAAAYALARGVDHDTSVRLLDKLSLDVAAEALGSPDELTRELALVPLMYARGEGCGDFGMSTARTPEELSMAVSRWRDWWRDERKRYPEFNPNLTIRQ